MTTWPRPCATSGIAMEQVSSFVKENEDALSQQHQGPGAASPTSWSSSGPPSRRRSTARPDRAGEPLPHLQPAPPARSTPGPTCGENLTQLETDPLGTLCSLTTTVDPDGTLCDQFVGRSSAAPPRAAPTAAGGAGSGTARRIPRGTGVGRDRAASTPRWPGSWRCSDERPSAHRGSRGAAPASGAPAAERLRLLRLRPAAARRGRRRRRPLPGHRRVPRRARPGAAVGGQGRRRVGRHGSRTSSSTATPPR